MKRKKVVVCLFGEYYSDDRILKKVKSLSKLYDVTVISINANSNTSMLDKRIVVKNIFFKSRLKLYFIKHFNYFFWKKIVRENPAEIYDCNDPDTMMAGIYAKKYWNSKIVYDAHELWSDVAEKQKTVIETIYSFVSSKILYYLYEKPLIRNFNAVITVNDCIKKILKDRYKLLKIQTIYNYSNVDLIESNNKQNSVVFIGGKRAGVEEQLLKIKKHCNLKPVIIGFSGNNSEIEYLGFLKKEEYRLKLKSHKLGLFSYDVNCKNTFYATPNKIFQYLQAEVPIIAIDTPGTKFIKKYNVGETFTINNDLDLINKINKILNNYNYYLGNIKKYKLELSWENQEVFFLKIYN